MTCGPSTRSPCTSLGRRPGSGCGRRCGRCRPAGTVSYTQLAAQAGNPRAPRAAGAACAYNLIAPVVPCHRALRSDGTLGGYYYGLDRKTWLLRHEGARPA